MIATVTLNASIDKCYLVDKLGIGSVLRVQNCISTPGGKGINVARVAAAAGEQVIATGFIGGHSGAYLKEMLQDYKQISSKFTEVPGESRTCINVVDSGNGVHTEFLEPGFTVSKEKKLEFLANLPDAIRDCGVLSISGSLPQGVENDFYCQVIQIAKVMGKKVLLDTSGKPLAEGIKACPTLIKPNRDELLSLLGQKEISQKEIIDTAIGFHKSGIEVVVVSLGKEGFITVCDQGVFTCSVPTVSVKNTVGCGDALVAGFCIGFSRNYPVEETIRQAAAISTASAMCEQTGGFIQKDYLKVLKKAEVKLIQEFESR